jgi:type 1 glutamine amidotransferase
MRKKPSNFQLLVILCCGIIANRGSVVSAAAPTTQPASEKTHVVLISAEPEYQSEASLRSIAQELESKHDMRCTMVVGTSDKDVPGLEILEKADLVIIYMRFLTLSDEQMKMLRAYFDSGRPLVAIRTSTHAFLNWQEFAPTVLGTPYWQYHYGHESSSDIRVIPEAADHPILRGVDKEFHSRSWLYYVHPLNAKVKPLMIGKSVGPSQLTERVENPVAWTFEHKNARVFYTSMGHPDDFKLAPFRKMLINAIHWSLNRPAPKTQPTSRGL